MSHVLVVIRQAFCQCGHIQHHQGLTLGHAPQMVSVAVIMASISTMSRQKRCCSSGLASPSTRKRSRVRGCRSCDTAATKLSRSGQLLADTGAHLVEYPAGIAVFW